MVRAKFQLCEITDRAGTSAKTLKFFPRYDLTIEEDQRFSKATPSGELTMYVDNPSALEQLKLGEDYYLDFTLAPKAEPKPSEPKADAEG
jgi:hypothetical protein